MSRACGDCTLCCKLLPVVELDKKANTDCAHQCATGCAIYGNHPFSYKLWSCRWLNGDAQEVKRPDKTHYVIDAVPDKIIIRDNDTGEDLPVGVIQVWVDPAHPDAHEDKRLRRFLNRKGYQGLAAIIRYDSHDGFVLFPPSMTRRGWVMEKGQAVDREKLR